MSNSVRPHRWQPTRLPRPWDSPGKNTGVGCHFLLQGMKVKSEREVTQSCPTDSSRPHGLQPTRLLCPWDFPGKSTGVGCHRLLPYEIYSNLKVPVQQTKWKDNLQTGRKKLKITQTNGKINFANGLEELKLFKWPYISTIFQ